jgi:hypothetical protein
MGILDAPCTQFEIHLDSVYRKTIERRLKAMKAGWARRQLIFLAGERGWWSEEDESKVEWTKQ